MLPIYGNRWAHNRNFIQRWAAASPFVPLLLGQAVRQLEGTLPPVARVRGKAGPARPGPPILLKKNPALPTEFSQISRLLRAASSARLADDGPAAQALVARPAEFTRHGMAPNSITILYILGQGSRPSGQPLGRPRPLAQNPPPRPRGARARSAADSVDDRGDVATTMGPEVAGAEKGTR